MRANDLRLGGIEALAKYLEHARKIEHLDLSDNDLGAEGSQVLFDALCPSEGPRFRALSYLGLEQCEIKSLDGLDLDCLPKLDTLILGQLDELRPEVVASNDAKVILNSWRERNTGTPLGDVKFLIIGSAASGKSHLRSWAVWEPGAGEEPAFDPHQDATHEVVVRERPTPTDIVPTGNLRFFDFGGQPDLLGVSRFFYANQRNTWIVCASNAHADGSVPDVGRRRTAGAAGGGRRLSYWLRLARDAAGAQPLIVVQTWSDQDADEEAPCFDAASLAKYYEKSLTHVVRGFSNPNGRKGWKSLNHAITWALDQDVIRTERERNMSAGFHVARKMIRELFESGRAWKRWDSDGWPELHSAVAAAAERPVIDAKDLITGYLLTLNALGYVHYVFGRSDLEGEKLEAIRGLVFNPERIMQPVYRLVTTRGGSGKAVLDRDEVISELTKPCFDEERRQTHKLNVADAEEVVKLLEACELVFRLAPASRSTRYFIPDRLRSIPRPQREDLEIEWKGCPTATISSESQFIPDHVLLAFGGDRYSDLKQPMRDDLGNPLQWRDCLLFKDRDVDVIVMADVDADEPTITVRARKIEEDLTDPRSVAVASEETRVAEEWARDIRKRLRMEKVEVTSSFQHRFAPKLQGYELIKRLAAGGQARTDWDGAWWAKKTEENRGEAVHAPTSRQLVAKIVTSPPDGQPVARLRLEHEAGFVDINDLRLPRSEIPELLVAAPPDREQPESGETIYCSIRAYADGVRLDLAAFGPDRPSLSTLVDFFASAAEAVGKYHPTFIHSDLSPANILVEMTGRGPEPRIIDFGIVKKQGVHITRGWRPYTPGLGPEQLRKDECQEPEPWWDCQNLLENLVALTFLALAPRELTANQQWIDCASLVEKKSNVKTGWPAALKVLSGHIQKTKPNELRLLAQWIDLVRRGDQDTDPTTPHLDIPESGGALAMMLREHKRQLGS